MFRWRKETQWAPLKKKTLQSRWLLKKTKPCIHLLATSWRLPIDRIALVCWAAICAVLNDGEHVKLCKRNDWHYIYWIMRPYNQNTINVLVWLARAAEARPENRRCQPNHSTNTDKINGLIGWCARALGRKATHMIWMENYLEEFLCFLLAIVLLMLLWWP